eukprot:SAG11_NODE_12367_length_706_cov_18.724876_1_plen_79_part_00
MSNYILICNNYVVVARGRARIIFAGLKTFLGFVVILLDTMRINTRRHGCVLHTRRRGCVLIPGAMAAYFKIRGAVVAY